MIDCNDYDSNWSEHTEAEHAVQNCTLSWSRVGAHSSTLWRALAWSTYGWCTSSFSPVPTHQSSHTDTEPKTIGSIVSIQSPTDVTLELPQISPIFCSFGFTHSLLLQRNANKLMIWFEYAIYDSNYLLVYYGVVWLDRKVRKRDAYVVIAQHLLRRPDSEAKPRKLFGRYIVISAQLYSNTIGEQCYA